MLSKHFAVYSLICYVCSSQDGFLCSTRPSLRATCPPQDTSCLKIITTYAKHDNRFPIPSGNDLLRGPYKSIFWGDERAEWIMQQSPNWLLIRKCGKIRFRFQVTQTCGEIKHSQYNLTVCTCSTDSCNSSRLTFDKVVRITFSVIPILVISL